MWPRLRERLHALLEVADETSAAARHLRAVITALILANCAMIILETVPELDRRYRDAFNVFEAGSVLLFTLEYLVRVAVCTADPRYASPVWGRLRYMVSPLALIDLLAILPFYAPALVAMDLRILRVFRLLRLLLVLKLGRYSTAFRLMAAVLRSRSDDLLTALSVLVLCLVFASALMYQVEHAAQPEVFESIPAAMWWAVATLTTVGYGDVYPVTPVGKMLGACIALLGIGFFALSAGILSSGFAEHLGKKKGRRLCATCPECGADIRADTQED